MSEIDRPGNAWPAGDGEMAGRIRAYDWASTPLGPIETWPHSLKTVVNLMLGGRQPIYIAWGPELTSLYNEGYIPILGSKHPDGLGKPYAKLWPEIWDEFRPIAEATLAGKGQHFVDRPVAIGGRPDVPVGWFTFSWTPLHDDAGEIAGIYCAATETTERVLSERRGKEAEAALHESEDQQAFQLQLSDALRPLGDPVEVMTVASELLGRHLGVGRCGYGEVDETGEYFIVARDWTDGKMPSFRGTHLLASFGPEFTAAYRAGRSVRIDDALADARAAGAEAAFEAAGGVRASLGIPLIKDGRFVAGLFVQQMEPRHWTDRDEALAVDVVERTWATVVRARAEAAIRESEERYRTLFESIDEGFTIVETVRDANGHVTDLIYREANEAYARQAGFQPYPGLRMKEIAPDVEDEWIAYCDRVSSTGVPETKESFNADLKRWYRTQASRIGPKGSPLLGFVFEDVTERKLAEQVLRVSEERQTFLLKLSDALRPLDDPTKIATAACRLLVEQLGGSQAQYANLAGPPGEEMGEVSGEYFGSGAPFPHRFPLAPFGEPILTTLRSGQTLKVRDVDTDVRLDEAQRRAFHAVKAPAVVSVPLVKKAHWLAALTIQSLSARDWNVREVELVEEVAERTWATIERARAETALRESEERQTFLLKLSDTLRAELDADAILHRAVRMLADELRLDRCYATAMYPAEDRVDVIQEFRRPDLAPMPSPLRFSDFPEAGKRSFDRTLIFDDTANDPELTDADKRSLAAMSFGALLSSVVRRGAGNPIWALGGVSSQPRHWTPAEVALIEEVTERTWAAVERTRAEAGLRESEARFKQFADASSGALWIRNAETLSMEYASPAMRTIYGTEPDALLGDLKRWAAMVVPDDRDVAIEHIANARSGDAVVHEFRIRRPTDGAFRWIRNTDFPLFDEHGRVQRIGGIAEDVTEAKLATEHTSVLLAELQHRVRNIMAIIRSITTRTGERAGDVAEYTDLMLGRLTAFARVQALLTRAANVSVGIAAVVHDEVSVQAQHEGQYVLEGPDIELSPKAAEVLTLAVHELATNALKYGALSAPDGKVSVTWSTFERNGGTWLSFDWSEEGAPERATSSPDTPRRRGFGSELIEGRVPYELRGKGTITIEPGGARCHLEFPLTQGASILATGAPQRATVFGGALDMTGEADLDGNRVLVVEDDYYLAADATRALEGARAEVIGPCATEEEARMELEGQRPDAVVLDINLGAGASFKLAEHLKDKGIPFVFVTGYDREIIPTEFEGVERLEKPVQLRHIVGAVSRLLPPAA